jgi:hypothetical protein
MLPREEYVEQAYFFRVLRERMQQAHSTQDLLTAISQEVLATTRLPYAIEFMTVELKHTGGFSSAMARLPHYFTPFQTYVVAEAESETGRFDFRVALDILQREAEYRSKEPTPAGMFVYQFETLCRNRLGYDRGLEAIAGDPIYDDGWREWVLTLRRQIGLIDFADMLYVRSELYRQHRGDPGKPILFGEKEGRIALANRQKDPLYLFSALERHLGYPKVPRPRPEDQQRYLLPRLERRVERLESRIRLLEEELRGGINLSRYYRQDQKQGEKDTPSA